MQTNKQSVQRCVGLIGLLAGLTVSTLPAPAQFGVPRNQDNRKQQNRNDRNRANRGTIQLPEGVDNVTSIDAIGTLIAETSEPETGENRQYLPLIVRHVYSGGIARVLGGDSVPTTDFITPAFTNGNNSYGNTGYGNNGVVSNGGQFLGGGFGQGLNQGGFPGFNGGNNSGNFGIGNGFNSFNNTNILGGTNRGLYNVVPTPNFGMATPTPADGQTNNRIFQPAPR